MHADQARRCLLQRDTESFDVRRRIQQAGARGLGVALQRQRDLVGQRAEHAFQTRQVDAMGRDGERAQAVFGRSGEAREPQRNHFVQHDADRSHDFFPSARRAGRFVEDRGLGAELPLTLRNLVRENGRDPMFAKRRMTRTDHAAKSPARQPRTGYVPGRKADPQGRRLLELDGQTHRQRLRGLAEERGSPPPFCRSSSVSVRTSAPATSGSASRGAATAASRRKRIAARTWRQIPLAGQVHFDCVGISAIVTVASST